MLEAIYLTMGLCALLWCMDKALAPPPTQKDWLRDWCNRGR